LRSKQCVLLAVSNSGYNAYGAARTGDPGIFLKSYVSSEAMYLRTILDISRYGTA